METRLNLCEEKKNTGALVGEVKLLPEHLTEARNAQKKFIVDQQTRTVAVTATQVAMRNFLVQTQDVEKLRSSHNKTLFNCNAEAAKMNVPLAGAKESVTYTKYESGAANAHLR